MKQKMKSFTALLMSIIVLFYCMNISVLAEKSDLSNSLKKRYTVLVLDTSDSSEFLYNGKKIYTADTAVTYVKQAAKKFLKDVICADGTNYVAVVSYKSTASVVSEFTTDIDELNYKVDKITPSGNTRDISSGLNKAKDLFLKIDDDTALKNVVLFTTGMTNDGDYNYSGYYDSNTVGSNWHRIDNGVSLYAYANVAYDAAQELKNDNVNIYTIGLFQTMADMPSLGKDVVELFKTTAHDIATNSEMFYDVDDVENLEFAFGTIADNITTEVLKKLYIKQHMSYADSKEYRNTILQRFNDCLMMAVDDAKENKGITSYNTLDGINKIMELKMYEFDTTDDYELLLAQIFFSSIGEESIEDAYLKYFAEALAKIYDKLMEIPDFIDFLGDQKKTFESIVQDIKTGDPKDIEFINDMKRLFNYIDGYDDINFKEKIANEFNDENLFSFVIDTSADVADHLYNTASEVIMYGVTGEAYLRTSDMFGQVILNMRKNIAIDSENELFKPFPTSDKLVSDYSIARILGMTDLEYKDPLQNNIRLRDIAISLEEFYSCITDYRMGDASTIANNAIESMLEGSANVVLSNSTEATISLFKCLPVIREYEFFKKITGTGQALIDLFSSIDDYAYDGTMLLRLYCMEYIHYLTVDNLAGNPSSWENVPLLSSLSLEDYQFERAVQFDEAINIYKSIQIVAADYAENYAKNCLKMTSSSKKTSLYSLIATCSATSKFEIEDIHCHSVSLNFNDTNNTFTYDSSKLKIVTIACPVAVTVTEKNGGVLANLSESSEQVKSGYESYFYRIPLDDSDNSIKVVVFPQDEEYSISIVGIDSGIMNISIGYSDELNISDIRSFTDVPVEIDTYYSLVGNIGGKEYLYIDKDGDKMNDGVWTAKTNETIVVSETKPEEISNEESESATEEERTTSSTEIQDVKPIISVESNTSISEIKDTSTTFSEETTEETSLEDLLTVQDTNESQDENVTIANNDNSNLINNLSSGNNYHIFAVIILLLLSISVIGIVLFFYTHKNSK